MGHDTPAQRCGVPLFGKLDSIAAQKKLPAALLLSLAFCLLSRPMPAFGACAVSVLLLAISGLAPAYIGKRIAAINIFFLFLWLVLPFSLSPAPDAFAEIGPLSVRSSGLNMALLITLKGNAIALALLALAGSSPFPEIAHALAAMGVPQKLVVLLLLTHSNLERMAREYQRVFQAAKLRGFVPKTSPAAYATYASLIGLLLVRSWQRAQRAEEAMRLRCFCGRFPLIAPRRNARNTNGKALPFVCGAVAAILVTWNYYG